MSGPGTHVGLGKHRLSVERLSDSCDPPRWAGAVGDVIAVVDAHDGELYVSVSTCGHALAELSKEFACVNGNVNSEAPFEFSRSVSVGDNCSLELTSRRQVIGHDSHGFDVRVTEIYRDVSACAQGPNVPSQDCTSDRIFHYEWLTSCFPDFMGQDPEDCLR